MKKAKPLTHFSKVEGAVYASRDSGGFFNYVWSARFGVKKYHGCVAFYRAKGGFSCRLLNDRGCNSACGDHPAKGEAWLVIPKGDYWLWTRVDTKIGFSK